MLIQAPVCATYHITFLYFNIEKLEKLQIHVHVYIVSYLFPTLDQRCIVWICHVCFMIMVNTQMRNLN